MVTLNLAFTAPVNPPGASPVLTTAQLWAGLQRKIRFAHEFVPVIGACDVLSEEEGGRVVTREVAFKQSPEKRVREVCRSYEPARVDFNQTNGSTISNIISDGAGGPADLYMTYCFEWQHPDVAADSDEARKLLESNKGTSRMAVEKSIESIREMVRDGRIKV
ncbi:DUF1857-domain-containing protein [Saccharata proteae CBS 121410]|uniref:DUF1857-domain-containing protein n=1 Tax=Saccharata proteae CBS 121410 TaxID=1314787 RepID=A0A9P4LW66_9PEZI|nr:DUF1857-domain-containing protein [Saccharata proteae CBS 121410]